MSRQDQGIKQSRNGVLNFNEPHSIRFSHQILLNFGIMLVKRRLHNITSCYTGTRMAEQTSSRRRDARSDDREGDNCLADVALGRHTGCRPTAVALSCGGRTYYHMGHEVD